MRGRVKMVTLFTSAERQLGLVGKAYVISLGKLSVNFVSFLHASLHSPLLLYSTVLQTTNDWWMNSDSRHGRYISPFPNLFNTPLVAVVYLPAEQAPHVIRRLDVSSQV